MAELLSNPFGWIAVAAWLGFVVASAAYIRNATKLAELISNRCPELWDKIGWISWWQRSSQLLAYYRPRRAYGLERLVLFNRGAADHPKDPEFRYLLGRARTAIVFAFLTFTLAIISTGKADLSAHSISNNQATEN